jgi:hypothetical protein
MLPNTDTRMQVARQRTGEANIVPVRTQLSILRERGILVDVNITGTTIFKKALSWLESGINLQDDDRLNYFTKGSKYVWNDEQVKELNSVVAQMRQLLKEETYGVTGFHPYRFMPFTAHANFVARWSSLSSRFYAIKASMIENRDAVVDTLAEQYAKIAEDIFASLTAKNKAKYIVVTFRNGDTKTLDRIEWVSFMVENTVKAVPAAHVIEEQLHADYVTGLLYTDVDNMLDNVGVNRAHQDMLANTNNDPRVSEMLRHEAQRASQSRNNSSPFMEVFAALREEIAESASEILAKVGGKNIHGKVAEKARNLLDVFDRKAAHNDDELRALLVSLRNEAKSADDESRNVEAIRMVLEMIVQLKPNDIKVNAFTAIELE